MTEDTAPPQACAAIAAPPAREARVAGIARLADGLAATHFVPYLGGYRKAPVASVPAELLVYRVENGRLIAELREHVRRTGQDLKRLQARQESDEVQQLLHGFLVSKAADPKGPILQELARQAQQTEPLLITADGEVVNGNRRLAAMRELFCRDPDRYAAFRDIMVAVLPADAKASDVEAVEAALQLAPETKLAYGWINRRLKLRRQLEELGLSREVICEAYRFESPADIDKELGELDLAEDYLDHYARDPGAYSLIADAELLFVGLSARLKVLPPDLAALWRLAGFCMIFGRAAVTGPMDRHFPFAEPVPPHLPVWALRRFAEELELVATEPALDEAAPIDAGVGQSLAVVLSDSGRSAGLAQTLFELMERLRAEFQERQNPARMLKLLQKLRHTMDRLQPERLGDNERRQLQSQLAAIQAQAAVLLGRTGPIEPENALGRVARLLRRG